MIVCPNKDKPVVYAAAEKVYQEWLVKSRKRNKKRKDKPLDYNSLNKWGKVLVHEGVSASMCVREQKPDKTLPITTDSSRASNRQHDSSSFKQAKMTILIVDISVLSSASHNKSNLPALIVTNFPHIHLQLGAKLNTAATLTTGNFNFFAAIARRYPHCIAKIFVPEEYNSIALSGIVQQGGESVTTELLVGFQSHVPYLMRDGLPTIIVIATGPHITVKTIVGLPFIQATQAIIDYLARLPTSASLMSLLSSSNLLRNGACTSHRGRYQLPSPFDGNQVCNHPRH